MKNLPENITEQEFLDVVDDVVNKISQRFVFGYHDVEDIKQQGRLYALEGIGGYDGRKPLGNFLWTHVKNRLCNDKRDKYERPQIPCTQCMNYDDDAFICSNYEDIYECPAYAGWYKRNSTKKNLMIPLEYDQVDGENEPGMSVVNCPHINAVNQEIINLVDQNIPLDLRSDYLKMRAGVSITKVKKTRVQEAVKEILRKNGYYNDEESTDKEI